jgi:hypothetical protein
MSLDFEKLHCFFLKFSYKLERTYFIFIQFFKSLRLDLLDGVNFTGRQMFSLINLCIFLACIELVGMTSHLSQEDQPS